MPGDNQESNIILLREHAYKMNGFSSTPDYAMCGQAMVSNVKGSRSERTVYWRGGYGCFDYKIERNDQSKSQNDANWKVVTTGVNDFKGYYQDTGAVSSNAACTYYRVTGENYDKKYSNASDVYSFCF